MFEDEAAIEGGYLAQTETSSPSHLYQDRAQLSKFAIEQNGCHPKTT